MAYGRGAAIFAAATALAATTAVHATERTMVTVLSGSQEVPPNATASAGCGRFEVDIVNNVLTYHIAYGSLPSGETAAHIHGPALPGTNAGVQHTLPAGNPKVGSWNYPEALEADILAGRMYVNVHSNAFGGGEVRGQIVDMVAAIENDQAGTGSAGAGVGLFNVDEIANTLDYHIIYGGLTGVETAAHIHGFAMHGSNAGIKHTLPGANPKIGTWVYAEADEAQILAGQTYVNIHTTTSPGGEIRGQVTRIVAPLDGAQSSVVTAGHGCGFIALDEAGDALSYYLTYQDTTGPATAAHIHGFAPPGSSAGILHNVGTTNPDIDTWTYGAANEANVLADLTYFNIHTAAHSGGEIRGQIEFPVAPCPVDLDCDGSIGFGDLLQVLSNWGPCTCVQDLDGDGMVGFGDLLLVLSNWGPC